MKKENRAGVGNVSDPFGVMNHQQVEGKSHDAVHYASDSERNGGG